MHKKQILYDISYKNGNMPLSKIERMEFEIVLRRKQKY